MTAAACSRSDGAQGAHGLDHDPARELRRQHLEGPIAAQRLFFLQRLKQKLQQVLFQGRGTVVSLGLPMHDQLGPAIGTLQDGFEQVRLTGATVAQDGHDPGWRQAGQGLIGRDTIGVDGPKKFLAGFAEHFGNVDLVEVFVGILGPDNVVEGAGLRAQDRQRGFVKHRGHST